MISLNVNFKTHYKSQEILLFKIYHLTKENITEEIKQRNTRTVNIVMYNISSKSLTVIKRGLKSEILRRFNRNDCWYKTTDDIQKKSGKNQLKNTIKKKRDTLA